MTLKKDPGDLKRRGREKLIPADARNRTIRCTEPEYAALMAHLRGLRASPPCAKLPAISGVK